MLLEGLELLADEQPSGLRLGGHQLDPAFREVQHLQRARVLDQPRDVLGDQLFRADQHIDR